MYKLSKKERAELDEARGCYPPEAKWYAVMTRCGREQKIQDWLNEDEANSDIDEVFLPEIIAEGRQARRSREPAELLFSSYLFLHCRMKDEIYLKVNEHRDVFQILGRSFRIPATLDEAEVKYLKAILRSGKPRLTKRAAIGRLAEVTEGLLAGMEGRIIEVNAKQVKLEVHFSSFNMGASVAVSVPAAHVREVAPVQA